MPTDYLPLPGPLRPLLNKFYRSHRSPMRAGHEAQPWVARQEEIIAALCLSPVADGQWLTGLFVAPAWRGQGVGARLVGQALAARECSTWLFCHPDLQGFYQRLGFSHAAPLPAALAERLARYARSKPLLAMVVSRQPDPARETGSR